MFTKWTASIAILIGCLALGAGRPNARLPTNKISGIVFLDSSHGFVQLLTLSHPQTYETIDGGRTWKQIEGGVPGFRTGRSFANKLKGWSIDEKSEYKLANESYDTV